MGTPGEKRTMTTYRRADGGLIGEYDFVLDIESVEADAEFSDDGPVTYVYERWVLERADTLTLPTCNDMTCDLPATFWGLCEKHAREDDPEAFTDTDASGRSGPPSTS